jgi:hypothetical protein
MPRGQRDKVSAGFAKQVSDDAEIGYGGGDHRWSGDAGRSFPLAYPIGIGAEEQATASGGGKPEATDKRGNSREGVRQTRVLTAVYRKLQSAQVRNRPGPASCLKTIDWPLGDFYELDDQDY